MRFRYSLFLGLFLMGHALVVHADEPAKKTITQEALKMCNGEVSDECVVRHFKDSMEASIIRGHAAFLNYCILCHGPEGLGNGRAAKLHTPPPFNLTLSVAPREYIAQMIRKGGEANGRGKGMPPWGEQLTDEQINDLLNFLFSIRKFK
ncbi:c-type cytochrome [Undibacterium sp. MH2W]|uniref:c-type cytochrome n=1 Tax=Undibacterium sp. MH2W TaxID=3413044 RepID=UPI003BEFC83D